MQVAGAGAAAGLFLFKGEVAELTVVVSLAGGFGKGQRGKKS